MLMSGQQPASNAWLSLLSWDKSTSGAGRYFLEVPAGKTATFSVVLTWHRTITPNANWSVLTPSLADLNLRLSTASAEFAVGALVAESRSPIDMSSMSINGATSSTLNLNNVQSANAGSYAVTATNGSGSVTSSQQYSPSTPLAVVVRRRRDRWGRRGGAPSCGFAALCFCSPQFAEFRGGRKPAGLRLLSQPDLGYQPDWRPQGEKNLSLV